MTTYIMKIMFTINICIFMCSFIERLSFRGDNLGQCEKIAKGNKQYNFFFLSLRIFPLYVVDSYTKLFSFTMIPMRYDFCLH